MVRGLTDFAREMPELPDDRGRPPRGRQERRQPIIAGTPPEISQIHRKHRCIIGRLQTNKTRSPGGGAVIIAFLNCVVRQRTRTSPAPSAGRRRRSAKTRAGVHGVDVSRDGPDQPIVRRQAADERRDPIDPV